MNPELVGWLGLATMLILIALRVHIAFALGFIGLVGFWVIAGSEPALRTAAILPYGKIASYTLSAVPLFMIMGYFAHEAGFATDVFRTSQKWLGHLPGGLVQATMAGAAAFGAACGSGIASCAVVSKVTVPEMLRAGVDRRLAFGSVAAAGTLAQMIPPSVIMVIYGILTETSVARLLVAGILPGIVATINFMILIYVLVKRNPSLAPLIPKASWKERLISLKDAWGIVAIASLVMGGIYTGIFTPTEAGAVGAFGAFVGALALRRLSLTNLRQCLLETASTTAVVFVIVACAFIFSSFLAVSHIPTEITKFLTSLSAPRLIILIGIMLMYVIAGTFIDMIPVLCLTLPFIFPAIIKLGYNPIWFGVLMVQLCEIGLVTPPVALNLFVIRSSIPGAELKEVIDGVLPFTVVMIITLAIYIAFPQIALFLPDKMMG